jgi:hypothetical protein
MNMIVNLSMDRTPNEGRPHLYKWARVAVPSKDYLKFVEDEYPKWDNIWREAGIMSIVKKGDVTNYLNDSDDRVEFNAFDNA